MSRRLWTGSAMLWTLAVTILRAARLPNDFAKEHWFIDYRFGFVKRGLVGTVVSLTTRLARIQPTERLIDVLSIAWFLVFCFVLMWLGLHLIRRSGWSTTVTMVVLVFLSSPFMVMSAHLIGYYDNIIIVLTVLSLALLFKGWTWCAVVVQAMSILVHENALLVGFPVFCWGGWLARTHSRQSARAQRPVWPLLVPVGAFLMVMVSQSLAPHGIEQSLTAHLSSYPFIAGRLGDVRVPHWITITFYDSYVLHQGQFLARLLSQPMIGLILPSMLALLGFVVDANDIGALSLDSAILVGASFAPEVMHVMAWDTARIWTYSILNAYLLLWVYVETFGRFTRSSQLIRLLCLVALFLNVIEVTPLMDGLRDHFDVTTRLMLYAPVFAVALRLAWLDRPHLGRGIDHVAIASVD